MARQETIDENILPLRLGKKKSSRREKRSGWKFDPRRNFQTMAYAALAVFTFFFFLIASLPLHRLSNQVLQAVSQATRMEWDAKEVGFGLLFGPRITFTGLTITPPAQMASGDVFSRIIGKGLPIEELTFRPNLWQLLPIPWLKPSNPSGSFTAEVFGASLAGSFIFGNKVLDLNLNIVNLDFSKIPEFKETYGLSGALKDFEIDLYAPMARLAAANGEIRIQGEQLQINPSIFTKATNIVALGQLQLGKISGKSRIKNGQLTINELSMSGKDSDLESRIEGDIRLNDNIMSSEMNLIIWVTPSARVLPFVEVPLSIYAEKKPNNSFALRLQGTPISPVASAYKGG